MSNQFTRWSLFLFAIATLVSQSAMDAFATLFAMGFLWMVLEKGELSAGFKTLNWKWILAAWFGLFALGLVININHVTPRSFAKLFDFRWLILAMMIGSLLISAPPSVRTWKSLQVALLVSSLFAILVFAIKKNPMYPEYALDVLADGTVRTGGFLLQPIVFAHLYSLWTCLFAGILFVVFDNNPRKAFSRQNVWLHLAIGTSTIAVLLSFTRGVWLSLFFALFIMVFVVRRRLAVAFLVVTAVALSALLYAWPPVRERVSQSFNSQDSERMWIWKANFEIFKDYPILGPGYNENANLLSEYLDRIRAPEEMMDHTHAHNQFLHILAGTGVLGFLSYLAFWIFLTVASIRAFVDQRSKNLLKAGVALGIFGAILSFLISGITESNFEHSKIRYTWALLVGLLIWVSNQAQTPPASIPKK